MGKEMVRIEKSKVEAMERLLRSHISLSEEPIGKGQVSHQTLLNICRCLKKIVADQVKKLMDPLDNIPL